MRNGQLFKKEYRGQRSPEAFANFIREQLVDPIKEFASLVEVSQLDDKKRTAIGYFEDKDSVEYTNFRKIASVLKDDCVFRAGFGDTTRQMHPPGDTFAPLYTISRQLLTNISYFGKGQSIIAFRPSKARSIEDDETFTGDLKSYDELSIWITDKCVPLVREITFENAEELTEEGLPFLILFYESDDNTSIKKFSEVITRELLDEKR